MPDYLPQTGMDIAATFALPLPSYFSISVDNSWTSRSQQALPC